MLYILVGISHEHHSLFKCKFPPPVTSYAISLPWKPIISENSVGS